jgi:hypothetical protein
MLHGEKAAEVHPAKVVRLMCMCNGIADYEPWSYDEALALHAWLGRALGDRAAPDGYCVVPVSTVNDLLSVKPDKCPAKVREALYELASLASRPAGVPEPAADEREGM